MIKILYEDNNIVICEKEPGQLSEMSEDSKSLARNLTLQLNSEIYVLSRLDKPVGGVIMYAKNKAAAAKYSAVLAGNEAEKTYLAVIEGCPENDEGTLSDLLYHDKQKNKTYTVKRKRKGVKEVTLSYKILCKADNFTLISVKLLTGRTHQIRVQFASRKMPLTGDGKYGSKNNACQVSLFANSLSFNDPFTKKDICVTAEPDYSKYPWNIFKTE